MSRRRRQAPASEAGVLLVDKPAGPSSHEVVAWVRWVLGTSRVGHCGTLDPAATGLLVICVEGATRLVSYLTDTDKCYQARFVLGRSTTTADTEGETLDVAACTSDDAVRAEAIVRQLVGRHELPPPRFSAVKVAGQPAHVRARAGEVPELSARPMIVRGVDEVRAALDPVSKTVEVEAVLEVSKGTYIRSLAELLGRGVGRPGHLGALRRLASGSSSITDCRAVGPLRAARRADRRDGKPRWRIRPVALGGDEAERGAQAEWLRAKMIPAAEAWPLPWIELEGGHEGDAVLRRLLQGQRVEVGAPGLPGVQVAGGRVAVGRAEVGGGFVVARVQDGSIRPERTVTAPMTTPQGSGSARVRQS